MGMNWRYVHKENVDKQNPIEKALWVVIYMSLLYMYVLQDKNQKNFPLPNFTPASTFPYFRCTIHNLTKYYDVAVVWCLGYASIWCHT